VGFEKNGVDVPLEVVYRNERFTQTGGERFAVGNPDQQSADQTWPLGHSDRVEIGQAHAGLLQSLAHYRHDLAQVFARGQFGHHAAELAMNIDLRRNHAGKNCLAGSNHGRGGLIA
jgi:hypothetical protein